MIFSSPFPCAKYIPGETPGRNVCAVLCVFEDCREIMGCSEGVFIWVSLHKPPSICRVMPNANVLQHYHHHQHCHLHHSAFQLVHLNEIIRSRSKWLIKHPNSVIVCFLNRFVQYHDSYIVLQVSPRYRKMQSFLAKWTAAINFVATCS